MEQQSSLGSYRDEGFFWAKIKDWPELTVVRMFTRMAERRPTGGTIEVGYVTTYGAERVFSADDMKLLQRIEPPKEE